MLDLEEARRWRAEAQEYAAATWSPNDAPDTASVRIVDLVDEVERLRHNETAFDTIMARMTPDEKARIYQAVHEEREARGLE